MSDQLINKFKTMLTEAHIYDGGTIDKLSAHYTDRAIGNDRCGNCKNFVHPAHCRIVEGLISPGGWCKFWESKEPDYIEEKWDTETQVSPKERGKYKGKTKAELLKMYNKLKATGPHHKDSSEYGRMRELAFAIRAKSDWGKVK